MKIKLEDRFDFLLKIKGKIIDSFTSNLEDGFNRMHAEGLRQQKDVDLYYKDPKRYKYTKLSSTELYRGKNEGKSNSTCNSKRV